MNRMILKSMVVTGIFFAICAAPLSFQISPALAADTVKIGILDPQSGPAESVGRFYKAAIEFVVDEQNAKGGLLGKQIELFFEDDELKADVGIRKAKKLILEKKVNFLGVGANESLGLALNKMIADYNVIQLAYGVQNMELTGKDFSRYTFRTTQNLHNVVAGMALTVADKGYKKFYMLGLDILPAHGHTEIFMKELKKYIPGVEIVGEDYFPWAAKDFAPYISKIKAADPDVVMLAAFGPDVINMIKQSRKLGLDAVFLNHAIIDPYIMKELGDQADGILTSISYTMSIDTPANKELIEKFHAKHKNDKDFYTWYPFGQCGVAIQGWKMFFAAIEKAGSLDPEKIIPVFEGFEYQTPVGLWIMRACDHTVLMPMFGLEMKAGPNPFFNGSQRADVDFPWVGKNILPLSADQVAYPATSEYNSRCE